MVHATCAALHCLSSSYTDKDLNLKFHQFPHDPERRKIWIAACKRFDVIDKGWDFFKHKHLCSKHFQKGMYSENDRLKKSAVPSLHLTEKPLQHDTSTQTLESIQYANQQSENDVSILYVMPMVEKSSTTTHTQTEDTLPYDIKHVNIKEEIKTHTKIKESESVEEDVGIKIEYDDDADENSDSRAIEEDVEIKTEIVENEILPLLKSTQPLQSLDLEITKDGGTPSTQAKNLLQDIDQGLTAPLVNRTRTYPITTTTLPTWKREMDESIQTDRVIVLSQNADGSAGSINPEECRCKRNNYFDMTRLQFYKACSNFLSADFAITVRRRMHLDDVDKAESNVRVRRRKTRPPESVELNATGCGEVIAPDVVIASTKTAADSAETDLDAVDRVEGSAAVRANDCAQRLLIRDMSEILEDQGLETALHPKRMRMWQPLTVGDIRNMPEGLETLLHPRRECRWPPSDLARPDPTLPSPSPSPDTREGGPSPASIAVPSPAMFLECDGSVTEPASMSPVLPPPSAPRRSGRFLRDDGTMDLFYGSDPGSDESDNEDTIAMVIPRVLQSAMETPLDDEDEEDIDAAAVGPASAEPENVPPTATDQPWRCTPLIELGMNGNPEGPILITSAAKLTNIPPVSIKPEQELDKCIHVEPERPAACDLDKKDWDVAGNDHYDHVRQGVSDVSPPASLQSITHPVSETSGVTIKKRKRKRVRRFVEKIAEGSEFDSDIEDDFDLDEITSSGAGMARNIPDDDDLDESISKIVNSIERVMDDAIDGLVGVPNDFNWCANFDTFQGVPEEFSGPTSGPIEDYDTPYDAFTAIWSNDIIEHIVYETNSYAKQLIEEKIIAGTLKPSSRLRCWTDTDKDEVYMFFALHILMGLDQRTTQQEFWKCTGYLEMPKFRKLMKYSRFLLLYRVFHFEGASQDWPQNEGIAVTAKWRKIAPIVGHLNNKFSNLYNLHAGIAIDESLTKGRYSWVQAIKSKTAWNGLKSYELYDSTTGYLHKFEVYTEQNSKQGNFASLSEALAEKSTQVVMNLLTGLETRGHCITMDNFCNSPALARHLKSLGFDCLGTLRPNRKNVPLDIKNVPKNVAKGTTIARHCGDVSCIAWKDTKMVTMISTYHTSETCIDCKTGQELVKPIVIRDYNKTMKGVNLKDKKLSKYLFERKRMKRSVKWYIKFFIRLLNVSVRNAFILLSGSLNRRGMPLCTDRDFREELANSLLANSAQSPGEISAPIEETYTRLRKDILHVPKYHTNVADRWRCFICSRKGISKMVYSSCATCNEFICFEGCWSDWHSLQKLPPSVNVSCRKRKCSA